MHADVRDVLRQARQISEWTEGTFDVTFGALTDVWKFDQDQDNSVPTADAIRARLPLIDYRQIEIDDRAGTVFLTRKGMGFTSAASARATPSIARVRFCARRGCATS